MVTKAKYHNASKLGMVFDSRSKDFRAGSNFGVIIGNCYGMVFLGEECFDR
jgi:hypothetical protein